MSFNDLGLRSELIEAVEAKGYQSPSPIQAKAIPAILEGRDVLGGAQTGTGKTAAFALPLLDIISKSEFLTKRPRALVLAPTRELAAQVHQSFIDYGKKVNVRSTCIFGGVGFQPQISALRRGLDVIVATPGRLLDLCERGDAKLSAIEYLVLDEADRMLDMGFIHDIKKILKMMPEKRQNLFFSATYSKEVKQLADTILNNPAEVEVAARNATADRVDQEAYEVGQKSKRALLTQMINAGDWSQVLVFTRTKHGANRLATQLDKSDIPAMAIHGNKSQSARERALRQFKANEIRVLVATDIAARGLDIASLPYVVNFELPNVAEDYVHRIGRTGRAGKAGKAISFVCDAEEEYLWDIEKLLKKEIPLFVMNAKGEKVEVDRSTKPKRSFAPKKSRGGGGGRGGYNRGGGGGGRGGQNRGPRGGRSGGHSGGGRQGGRSQSEGDSQSSGRPSKKRPNQGQGGGQRSRPAGGGHSSGGGSSQSPQRSNRRNK